MLVKIISSQLISRTYAGKEKLSWLQSLIYKWADYHQEKLYNFKYKITTQTDFIRVGHMIVDQAGNSWFVLDQNGNYYIIATLSPVSDQEFAFESCEVFAQACKESSI